ERANAALAEDDVLIAAGEHVLGRQQPLFDRRRDAALEQDRLPRAAKLAQQRIILHYARAALVDVGIALDQLDLADLHDLGDELEIVAIGRRAQHPKSGLTEAL